jgi:glycosyltransferase 2 family protein
MSDTEQVVDIPKKKNNSGWLLQWGLGILLTGIAVFFLVKVISWEELKAAFQAVPPTTLLMCLVIYLISMGFRALSWQTLLQRRVSVRRAWLVMGEGYFLNIILPFRLGEIGRAFLMGRRTGTGMLNILPSIFMERAYDLAFASILLLSSLPFVLKMDWVRPMAILLLSLVILGLFSLYLAARYRDKIEVYVSRIGERSNLVKVFILPHLHSILDGFGVLTSFELFAISVLALGMSWFIAIFRDWSVLLPLSGGSAPIWWALLAISASNLGGALPSMAASLGTFEGAATGAMVLAGANPEVGLAYALIIHVIHIVVSTIIGLIGLSQEGKSLGSLIAELRGAR